jgi:hypothetical protein
MIPAFKGNGNTYKAVRITYMRAAQYNQTVTYTWICKWNEAMNEWKWMSQAVNYNSISPECFG